MQELFNNSFGVISFKLCMQFCVIFFFKWIQFAWNIKAMSCHPLSENNMARHTVKQSI